MTNQSGKISFKLGMVLAVLLMSVAVLVLLHSADKNQKAAVVPISTVLEMAESKQLKGVHLEGSTLTAVAADGSSVTSSLPPANPAVQILLDAKVPVTSMPEEGGGINWWLTFAMAFGPVLLLIAIWVWLANRQQGSNGGSGIGGGVSGISAMSRSKAKIVPQTSVKVSFADVAGCDEAKQEVIELVEFLQDPQKFQKLGGRIPKGVLMSGPPGTGKTLLAKSIAGEAKVPFFSVSGSDFVEMFVGVGAARVRDLFAAAKEHAPCIVFIDEIDAVGRKRGSGNGGGSDEREQTLNQLLVEMDGFEENSGIIVLAATNRPEMLDNALMRPGRFDRQVTVGLPDVRGREQILQVHLRKTPVDANVDVQELARGTIGFSGAELGNLINEAALFAAQSNRTKITSVDLELAKDKLMMGPERRSTRMPEKERINTAYHEAGHAILGQLLPTQDPVHKVSIMPRGRSLGVTVSLPQEDRYSLSKKRVLEDIIMLFGGRVAEELFTDDITTGASNDYDRANHLARSLVSRWGMSDAIGPIIAGEGSSVVFGFGENRQHSVSSETLRRMDDEVIRILTEQYATAKKLLTENSDKMHAMATALLKWETIDADQVADVMAGRPVREPRAPGAPRVPEVAVASAAAEEPEKGSESIEA